MKNAQRLAAIKSFRGTNPFVETLLKFYDMELQLPVCHSKMHHKKNKFVLKKQKSVVAFSPQYEWLPV
jgi:hypothetical protein